MAAAFELSYRNLPAAWQRLFRRLGLHPGPDLDAYAAAALDGTSLGQARTGVWNPLVPRTVPTQAIWGSAWL